MALSQSGYEFSDAMVELLANRFGDGSVYLRGKADSGVLDAARRQGLVDTQGFVTSEGMRYWLNSGRQGV